MRGPFRMPVRAMVVAIATVLFLTSCGSNSGTKLPLAAPSTTPGATSATTVKSFSGSGSGDFCSLVKGSADKVTNASIPTNPLQWKSLFEDAKKAIDQLQAKAPAEIKGDLDTIASAYDRLVTAIDSANGNLAQLATTLGSTFSSPEFKTAITNLKQYMTTVCKVTPPSS